jgi:hypothetical protein
MTARAGGRTTEDTVSIGAEAGSQHGAVTNVPAKAVRQCPGGLKPVQSFEAKYLVRVPMAENLVKGRCRKSPSILMADPMCVSACKIDPDGGVIGVQF